MAECVVCHQPLPQPEIALIFEDGKAMSYVASLLETIAVNISETALKNRLEAELSVSERELRFIVDSLAKAAGLEVSDPKDKEPGPSDPAETFPTSDERELQALTRHLLTIIQKSIRTAQKGYLA